MTDEKIEIDLMNILMEEIDKEFVKEHGMTLAESNALQTKEVAAWWEENRERLKQAGGAFDVPDVQEPPPTPLDL